MNKKVLLSALLGASMVAMPMTVSASSGWDYVGHAEFYYQSPVVESTGGDFEACLQGTTGWSGYVTMWEYDADSSDEKVGERYIGPGHCARWDNIGSFVDGSSNNVAEFYLTKPSDGKQLKVNFYD